MYLLYLDESGNENDPNDHFFVLGGIALFERQTYFLSQQIEEVHEKYFPNDQPIPFHASEMRSGRELWRKVPLETRQQIMADISQKILRSPPRGRMLFAAAVEKSRNLWGESAVEKTTEDICSRFDLFLQRRYHEDGDAQRANCARMAAEAKLLD